MIFTNHDAIHDATHWAIHDATQMVILLGVVSHPPHPEEGVDDGWNNRVSMVNQTISHFGI